MNFESAGDSVVQYSIQFHRCHKRDPTDRSLSTVADRCISIQEHSFIASDIQTSRQLSQVTESMDSSSSGTGLNCLVIECSNALLLLLTFICK